MKRLLLIGVAVAALGGAGVGGAVVGASILTIEDGEFARLGPTNVYCQAFYEEKYDEEAFDCGVWNGSHHVKNSYSAIIDELGVEIDRWDYSTARKYREIVTYVNP